MTPGEVSFRRCIYLLVYLFMSSHIYQELFLTVTQQVLYSCGKAKHSHGYIYLCIGLITGRCTAWQGANVNTAGYVSNKCKQTEQNHQICVRISDLCKVFFWMRLHRSPQHNLFNRFRDEQRFTLDLQADL